MRPNGVEFQGQHRWFRMSRMMFGELRIGSMRFGLWACQRHAMAVHLHEQSPQNERSAKFTGTAGPPTPLHAQARRVDA